MPEDNEEKALFIYKLIEEGKAKTKVAYELVKILERDYSGEGKSELLKNKLPTYVVDAIKYVTKPWSSTTDETAEADNA